MGRAGRAVLVTALPLMAGCVLARPSRSASTYSSGLTVAPGSLVATQFVPSQSPRPSVTVSSSAAQLQWSTVTTGATGSIDWVVRRSTNGGTPVNVCTGSSAPVQGSNGVTCTDSTLQYGASYTYTVQPVLVRFGTSTWSLPEGPASAAVALPFMSFAGAGPVVSTLVSAAVDVPYPAGTVPGDVLLLVVVNGRNRAPQRTVGWTDIASRGIGGTDDFYLYAGWRIADSAASTSVTLDGRVSGASLQILRWSVPAGAPTAQSRATQQVSGETVTASLTFTPSPDVVTTSVANALSVVAVRGATALTLMTPAGWTQRSFSSAPPGTELLSWAVADRFVPAAQSVPSPTWEQQSSLVSRWIFGGSALG